MRQVCTRATVGGIDHECLIKQDVGVVEMRRNRTWIVIADGAHVSVVQSIAGDPQLSDVADMHFSADLPATHELVTDRAGRSFASHGRSRHAKEGRTDPHRALKQAFAGKIAHCLKSKLVEKRYEHLVLIAPSVTLGHLRAALDKGVRDVVRAELPQDLVKLPPRKLRRHLLAVVPAKSPTPRRSPARPHRQLAAPTEPRVCRPYA